MCRVSVILPTYNESGNIGPLIEEILSYLPGESEIIVVDDDSPDRTWEIVAILGSKGSPGSIAPENRPEGAYQRPAGRL